MQGCRHAARSLQFSTISPFGRLCAPPLFLHGMNRLACPCHLVMVFVIARVSCTRLFVGRTTSALCLCLRQFPGPPPPSASWGLHEWYWQGVWTPVYLRTLRHTFYAVPLSAVPLELQLTLSRPPYFPTAPLLLLVRSLGWCSGSRFKNRVHLLHTSVSLVETTSGSLSASTPEGPRAFP